MIQLTHKDRGEIISIMLTQEEIKKFEEALNKDRERLEGEIKEMDTPVEFGDGLDPYEEESDEDEEFENRGSIGETLSKRLIEIQLALARIAEGKYGVCENCGSEIEKEILETAPESKLCKACKVGQ